MNTATEPDIHERDLFGEIIKPEARGPIAERFLIPPFSVLSARDGEWQNRKRSWLGVGIKGEVGRGEGASPGGSPRPACDYSSNERGRGDGKAIPSQKANKGRKDGLTYMAADDMPDYLREKMGKAFCESDSGTSIFDPVLCELAYRWFCPEDGQIVDPFAGGSVRGIVASMLGRKYWGCDLRPEQIAANEAQAKEITPDSPPTWICGDSAERIQDAPEADFLFSCPPYGDLEVYSDAAEDLSAMSWLDFLAAYRRIIRESCDRLKPDRFACFVVGDFRDPKGFYRDFPSVTTAAFAAAGLKLYNEAILVTAVGSLPIRIGRQFDGGRKLGKTHQNILVYCKGDWKKATEAIKHTEDK